jgi:hypothetical protein
VRWAVKRKKQLYSSHTVPEVSSKRNHMPDGVTQKGNYKTREKVNRAQSLAVYMFEIYIFKNSSIITIKKL